MSVGACGVNMLVDKYAGNNCISDNVSFQTARHAWVNTYFHRTAKQSGFIT